MDLKTYGALKSIVVRSGRKQGTVGIFGFSVPDLPVLANRWPIKSLLLHKSRWHGPDVGISPSSVLNTHVCAAVPQLLMMRLNASSCVNTLQLLRLTISSWQLWYTALVAPLSSVYGCGLRVLLIRLGTVSSTERVTLSALVNHVVVCVRVSWYCQASLGRYRDGGGLIPDVLLPERHYLDLLDS